MTFPRNLPGLLFVSALSLLLSSCASSERMMRVSPFTEEAPSNSAETLSRTPEKQQQIDRDGSRINVWPFLYKINDKTCVLWPAVDSDKKGFAVRPFYNQEGKEYSIMFPFSAWNPENGDGWVFSGYWNKKTSGVFPFIHNNDTFHYAFPVLWDKNYFCSPATMTYLSDDFNMAGPVWWKAESERLNGGFFPMVFITNGLYAFGPFWVDNGTKAEDKTALGFFPFASFAENKNYVFPFFSFYHKIIISGDREHDKYWTSLYIFPYYYYSEKNALIKPSKWQNLSWLLLWYSSDNQEKSSNSLIPFYFYADESKEKRFTSILGSVTVQKDTGDLSFMNILGFLYIYDNSEASKTITALFPLSYYKYDKKEKTESTFIFPYYNKSSEDKSLSIALPLYIYDSNKKEKSFYSLLAAAEIQKDTGEISMINSMGFLYIYDNSEASKIMSVLFPLSYYKYDKKDKTETTFIFPYYNKSSEAESLSIALPLYIYDSGKKEKSFYSLLASSVVNKETDDLSMLNIMGFLYIYDQSEVSKTMSVLFPLSYYNYDKKSKNEITFIFPYYQKNTEQKTISTFLPLYYYSGNKNTSNIVLPPLLSNYESSGEYNIMFPFMHGTAGSCGFWPLFSYKDRSGGAYLFEYNKICNEYNPTFTQYKSLAFYGKKEETMSYRILLNWYKSSNYKGEFLPRGKALDACTDFNILPITTSYKCYKKLNEAGQANIEEISDLHDWLDYLDTINRNDKRPANKEQSIAETKEKVFSLLKKHDCYKGNSDKELSEGLCMIDKKFTTEEIKKNFSFIEFIKYEYNYDKEKDKNRLSYANNFFLWMYSDENLFNSAEWDCFGSYDIGIKSKAENICQKKISRPIYTNYNLILLFNAYSEYSRETPVLSTYNNSLYETNFNLFFFYIWNHSTLKILNTDDQTVKKDIEILNTAVRNVDSASHSIKTEIHVPKTKANEKSPEDKLAEWKLTLAGTLKKYDCYKGESDDELAEGIAAMDEKYTKEIESSYTVIPGLFYNETEDKKSSGNIMFFFSRWNSDESRKKSMVNVLEYLFRYQHEEGNSYRDIFPFMSLDNGDEMFRISFLWRFAGYKKEKEERTWYLFFIPF